MTPAALRRFAIAVGTVGLVATASVCAAPDSLDQSFGVDGIARLGYLGAPPGAPGTQGTLVEALAAMPDGSMIVGIFSLDHGYAGLMRVDSNGDVDHAFGIDGLADWQGACGVPGTVPNLGPECSGILGIFPDHVHGGFYVVTQVGAGPSKLASLARFSVAGIRDVAFGTDGFQRAPQPCGQYGCLSDDGTSATQDAAGRVVVVGSACFSDSHGGCAPTAVRFAADGTVDQSFGAGGRALLPWSGSLTSVSAAPDGTIVGGIALIDSAVLSVVRLQRDGRPDPTFGTNGLLTINTVDARAADLLVLADGRVLVVAPNDSAQPARWEFACIARDGSLCTNWGANGIAALTWRLDIATYLGYAKLLAQPDGKVWAVGALIAQKDDRIAIARLDASGKPDLYFAGGGKATVWSSLASSFRAAILQPDGRLVVAGMELEDFRYLIHNSYLSLDQPMLMRFEGGNTSTPRPVQEDVAAEYYDSAFGHYFVTALASEISILNGGFGNDEWVPTGRQFKVWTAPSPELSTVCRFFSGSSFAPKSSHFYTPYANECALLKAGSVWTFEGNVFELRLAVASASGATCPAGTAPLYRLYNNGQGGAPNHRYTDDLALLDAMVAQGWIFEGDASTKVFACIPGD